MMKLTRNDNTKATVWVNPDQILYVSAEADGTTQVVLQGNVVIVVCEDADHIWGKQVAQL